MSRDSRSSDFFVAGGTLRPNTPSYVERPTDDELFNLALAGGYCYVLTPRQMGKSSLMVRTAQRLKKQGVRTATIDLSASDTIKADAWYLELITELARALRLSVDPEAWWQARASLGHTRRFMDFLRDVVLTEIEGQVVIFIDEIDSTLRLEFSDDFFAAIRAMYNARPRDSKFERLSFVLLGVASPSDLIKDRTRTPFNIGQGITLKEFSRDDAAVLQAGLEAIHPGQGEAIFARIYYWTGGHPYLTQKICQAVASTEDEPWSDEKVDELMEKLFLSKEASKEANLKFVQDRIIDHPQQRQLLGIYRKVYKGKRITDDEQSPLQNHLKLAGLVKAEDGYLEVRNEIYRRVFDLAWVRENTTVNWAPAVTGIAVFVALLAVGAILYNTWVGIRFQDCYASFYQTTAPKERVAHLSRIFRLRGLLGPTDYDYQARELFYGLSREEQLALFVNDAVEDSDMMVLIKGLYITLADVDNTDSTRPLLEAMVRALDDLGETEETKKLEGEINSWLEGRKLAKQSQYESALDEYSKAIVLNGENPATLYERAKVLTELSNYQQALGDLDQVMAIARRATAPTPTVSPTAMPAASYTLTPTSTSTPRVDITPTETPTPASATRVPTPSPISTEMPVPTATPTPAAFASEFATLAQMISAVRNVIYGNPDLVSSLASAQDSEYLNLREFGLVPTAQYDLYVRRMDLSGDMRTGETISLFIAIATDIYPSQGPFFPASHFRWRKGPGFDWQEESCPANTQYAQCEKKVDFSYSQPGQYHVEIQADNRNEVAEANEGNNDKGWTIAISPAHLYRVDKVSCSPDCGTMGIRGTVYDANNNSVPGLWVKAWSDEWCCGWDQTDIYAPSEILLGPGPRAGHWYVAVYDQDQSTQLSDVVEVYTDLEPCEPGSGGCQWPMVDFVRSVDFTPTPTLILPAALTGKIAFTVWNGATYDVWVANVDGSDRTMILENMRQPDFRGDGKIAVNGEAPDHMNLHVANADGSDLIEVSEHLEDSHPSWAPDGSRIVFGSTMHGDRRSRIYILDDVTKRTEGRVLRSMGTDTFGRDPCWLPDGRIAYNGCDYWTGEGNNCGLWATWEDGTGVSQLTDAGNDLSVDGYGNEIVFMCDQRHGNWEIYKADNVGQGITRLTNDPGIDGLPTWSPDGKHIAFLSTRDGQWAIWVMNADGSNQRKLFDLPGAMGPVWPDERISWWAPPVDFKISKRQLLFCQGGPIVNITVVDINGAPLDGIVLKMTDPLPDTDDVEVTTGERGSGKAEFLMYGEQWVWVERDDTGRVYGQDRSEIAAYVDYVPPAWDLRAAGECDGLTDEECEQKRYDCPGQHSYELAGLSKTVVRSKRPASAMSPPVHRKSCRKHQPTQGSL